jgi:DHA2 family multidrug resistance protein
MTDSIKKPEHPELSKTDMLAFFAMIVGMFMAVLDIQIVSSSISVIGAGLSASSDELSWIQTSYLIAEVIVIPVTGFAARLLSTRISYFIAACGFTVMSLFCSIAWSIESMIFFRLMQGLFGGAMIPTVFSTIFVIFPPEKRPQVTIVVGLVVTVAPTLGPTLGGYITDISSWHFMFLINLIPGIFVCSTVFRHANFDKPNYNLLNNFDFVGIIVMSASLGSLQYILEEGNRLGWFDDSLLLFLGCFVVSGLTFLVFWELSHVNPILDFTAFANKNFTFGCCYSFIMGIGLYGAVYLLPLFLFTVAGFSTLQIGITMMVTGTAQFLSAPIAGRLFAMGIDLRVLLAFGLGMFGCGCYLNSFLTIDSNYWEFFVPQLIRGGALMFCFIPTNNIALGSMPKEKVPNASGLYNLNRNLGGAIGLALMSSVIAAKTKTFSQYISENMPLNSSLVQERIDLVNSLLSMTISDDSADTLNEMSYALLSGVIQKNAFVLAINDIFVAVSLLFALGLVMLPFASNIKMEGESGAH